MKEIAPIPALSEAELTHIIEHARLIAKEAHHGQRHNEKPYITHPEAVAEKVHSLPLRPVALLHDVLEDTLVTEALLRQDFPPWVVDRVVLLTRPPGMSYADYILRAGADWACRIIKHADIEHNMSTLKGGSLRDKYALALLVLGFFDTTEILRNIVEMQRCRLHLSGPVKQEKP